MSRTNPNKRKRRQAKKTILFYCEGVDDKIFLEYLRKLFAKDSGYKINIKNSKGGGPNQVLIESMKRAVEDYIFCFYDTDCEIDNKLKQEAKKRKFKFIENTPCLESFLLEIIEGKNYVHHQLCCEYKEKFENKYLDKKKRKDKRNYIKVFPKNLLLGRAQEIKNLKMLIDIMSGKM